MNLSSKRVLILSAGNSARSILAEVLFNNLPRPLRKFTAYSAGSSPSGEVDPITIQLLNESGLPTKGLRSKGLEDFSEDNIELVIAIYDRLAGEACPVWDGRRADAEWHIRNPTLVEDAEGRQRAFKDVLATLRGRIDLMANLPVEKLDASQLISC